MKKKTKLLIAVFSFFIFAATGLFLYKYTNIFAKDQWTITQYGPRNNNSVFYTISNPKQGFIVIDGGWAEDAQYVKDILALHGNEVDLWILTHPHEDHIGAFNAIYPELEQESIVVHRIMTVNMASPEECSEVAPWDSMDAYNRFLELSVDNLEYVSTGDTFEIFDLKFQVLNAFGEHTVQYSKDYLNDGSMMFKVTNEEESMLFCSDVGVNMSAYLHGCWQKSIKVDYLQMGHHGYGGLEDYFYQTVSPKVAFFDAPEYMMFDETGKFDNPQNKALMEKMGCVIYYFKDGPNSIILK